MLSFGQEICWVECSPFQFAVPKHTSVLVVFVQFVVVIHFTPLEYTELMGLSYLRLLYADVTANNGTTAMVIMPTTLYSHHYNWQY